MAKSKKLKKYRLDEELSWIQTQLEGAAEDILNLCSDKRPDIVYGFELGQIYKHLRACFLEMAKIKRHAEDC